MNWREVALVLCVAALIVSVLMVELALITIWRQR